jgi:serine phosphatase RsbU (regulator of sigma subunit)
MGPHRETAMNTMLCAEPSPSGIEVKGAYITSAVQTLAEFRKLGELALAEQGVTNIEPHLFYPVALRRSVHSAIYDRFGTPGVYWVGLETPNQFNPEAERRESEFHQIIAPTIDALAQANDDAARIAALEAFIQAVITALNSTVAGSVRGHTFKAGWTAVAVGQASDLCFELTSLNTGLGLHEAFARGIMQWSLRTYMPDTLDFELSHVPQASRDHPGYSSVQYRLRFMPMAPEQTQALRLAQERAQAREALFGRALEHAVSQELRATQALQALALSHQTMVESIHYAAALQKQQLPKPLRWAARVRDLAVWWEPKDVIGGDMWWMDTATSTDASIRMALIDCTGHGVPGAMLALLVSNSLERIHLTEPSLAPLQAVAGVQQALQQSFGARDNPLDIDNGCDLLVLDIDPVKHRICAALAGLGLLLWRSRTQALEWMPSPRSGISADPNGLQRVAQGQLSYEPGDRLLLVTDGLTDQIGHTLPRRAFGYRRLQTALRQAHDLGASQCMEHLRQQWLEWQGDQLRRDDVTALVIDL